MKCRHCQAELDQVFLDLGSAPPSNAYLDAEDLRRPEVHYPLRVFVCAQCWLVQTEDYSRADELFQADYAYFSSMSKSWLDHAARYCATISNRLELGSASHVIEVASNDGYLLKNFVAAGIPCLGIEPTDGTADAAERQGVPVLREFFGEALGRKLAADGRSADLVIGNNVYAHVPDINDFTRGLRAVLKPEGVVTLEFPHLMRLVESRQFDTIYHEHYSYLSLIAVRRIFEAAGLRVFDVEELPTHGGSLRVYGCHKEANHILAPRVETLLRQELDRGMGTATWYESFQNEANAVKDSLLAFLLEQKSRGRSVAGYGAAAKGNTLLNYAGIRPDLLAFVCDAAPSKQGKFLPGSRIPIVSEQWLATQRPDYVFILPWNLREEIAGQLGYIREWSGRFVVAVPQLEVF